jgi:hypothetical protein
MTEATALGAAMAAVNAEGIDVWSLDSLANALNYLEIEMMSIFEINFFTCLSYLNEYVT